MGRDIYNYRCYFCHGYNGDAKTVAAGFIEPKPRSFIQSDATKLSRERMMRAVREGIAGTAMKSFRRLLTEAEMGLVVDFVRQQFMLQQKYNTVYHSEENGWRDFQQNKVAFPFVFGEVALDSAYDKLSPALQQGYTLYMDTCITCHDASHGIDQDKQSIWQARPLSFPRNSYSHRQIKPDSISHASNYSQHEKPQDWTGLLPLEQQGADLFSANCSFCHSMDGSGKNWIGSFIEPHPADLRQARVQDLSLPELELVIANGKKNSAMPAWKTVLSKEEIHAVAVFVQKVF
ncbi:MAG: c-type cytochrome [Gammaproteobacteria bacterium]|nr:c-type cytochrome [Gammaproteobacteria bacterium]